MHTLKAMCSNKKYPNISKYKQQFFRVAVIVIVSFSSYEEYIVVLKALITVVKSFSPHFMKNKQFELYS